MGTIAILIFNKKKEKESYLLFVNSSKEQKFSVIFTAFLETVHAILACNAGTEMSCMDNLDRINGVNDFPILKHLIYG